MTGGTGVWQCLEAKWLAFLGTNYTQEIYLVWFACLAPHYTCMKLGQHSPADVQSMQKPELFLLEMMSPR